MKLLPLIVAAANADNKSVKFVTGVTSVNADFPSDIIDLARNMFTHIICLYIAFYDFDLVLWALKFRVPRTRLAVSHPRI